MTDRIYTELREVCDVIKRGISPKYTDEPGLRVINQRCIRDYTVTFDNARLHDEEIKSVTHDKLLVDNDVLVNSTGVGTLGRVAQYTSDGNSATVDSHVTIVRLGSDSIDPKYFGWLLKSKQREIEFMGEGSTGQTELSRFRLGELNIDFPSSINIQKKIAEILTSVDQKIHLLRQQNATLEAIAQTLFRSWFVDFDPVIDNALAAGHELPEALAGRVAKRRKVLAHGDRYPRLPQEVQTLFPDRFTFSEELGKWVPEGWEVKPLNRFAKLDTTSVKPYNSPEKLWEHYSIPEFDKSQSPVSELGSSIKSGKYAVQPNSVLVSKLNPDTPRIWLHNAQSSDAAICSTEFMQFVPLNVLDKPFLFCLMRSKLMHHEIMATVTGSTGSRQRAQPRQVRNAPILVPKKDVLSTFNKTVRTLLDRTTLNINKKKSLSSLRDTLLPPLISGKLSVANFAERLEGVEP